MRAGMANKINLSEVTTPSSQNQSQAMPKRPEKASTSSGEVQASPQQEPRPFVVEEHLAYIDDNASANSMPISYSIRRREQDQQQVPVDVNVVFREKEREREREREREKELEKISLGRSQTQLELNKNSG